MENPFDHTEFESFLKEQADQLRLYPSEQSWRHIQHELHGHKKWPALTAISVFVISLLVIGTLIIKPEIKTTITASISNASPESNADITEMTPPENHQTTVIGPVIALNKSTFPQNLTIHNITQNTIASVSASLQIQNPQVAFIEKNPLTLNENDDLNKNDHLPLKSILINYNNDRNIMAVNTENPHHDFDMFNFALSTISQPITITGNYSLANFTPNQNEEPYYFRYAVNRYYNYNIEDILNISRQNYSFDVLKNSVAKLDFQFYLTPSVSYRRLIDESRGKNTGTYVSAVSLATSPYTLDANKLINYRPSIGYEVGFTLGYHLSDKFTLKSGFQFNMDQYNIDAYLYQENTSGAFIDNEPTVFSPFLVNRNSGVSNVPFTLKNRFYQVSLPIGLDYKIAEKGKLSWNVAAALQPTYTFDKEPFIVSTNYKDYADGSKLMRNWNVNGNVETYLSYKMGSLKWQVGPQFRYQFMPTMTKDYPIKEYLLNYGLKIGITKTIK
ncbi:MAG: outer membrane beta-barrel protein [Bacteroidetes bacterium]|nr:outer membrane beta-barrel protein [Bacteroidota bacterium]